MAAILAACGGRASTPTPLHWETAALQIETVSGTHRFTVEVADDEAERERGLMFRTQMNADAGMIFIYPDVSEQTMWMKNTVLLLDMVFMQADGTVSHLVQGAVPYSRDFIHSGGPVKAVLELNAGTAARIGVKPGDRVRFEAFGNATP